MPNTDPLDPAAVLEVLSQLLPRQAASASSSSSSSIAPGALKSPQDAIAAVLHAALTRLDFRLVGLAEDDRLSDYVTEQSEGSTSSSTPQNALPFAGWNRHGPESYTLRYRHDQSSLTFLLKLLRMSNRVLINASAVEDHKTATVELSLPDYTSSSFFPYPVTNDGNDAGTRPEPLVNGFISTSRLKDLLLLFKGKIIQKLIPGLRKDGYQEDDQDSREPPAPASGSSQPRRPANPSFDPDDDPSLPPLRGGGVPMPGRNPLAIGDRDLQPLGGMRPPGMGGGGAFGPPPLFGGAGGGGIGGGGMYVGPDDPIFRDRFGAGGGGIGGGVGGGGGGNQPRGPWGGDGFLPPGAVPPGARFDPIGPWGGPLQGTGPGAGRGAQGPPGTNTGGPANRNPDWDDVRPPRGDSDYDSMFM